MDGLEVFVALRRALHAPIVVVDDDDDDDADAVETEDDIVTAEHHNVAWTRKK